MLPKVTCTKTYHLHTAPNDNITSKKIERKYYSNTVLKPPKIPYYLFHFTTSFQSWSIPHLYKLPV